MSRLRHQNIVILMGCCPEDFCLVYEYCAHGSLEDRLKDEARALPWYTRLRIALEVEHFRILSHLLLDTRGYTILRAEEPLSIICYVQRLRVLCARFRRSRTVPYQLRIAFEVSGDLF